MDELGIVEYFEFHPEYHYLRRSARRLVALRLRSGRDQITDRWRLRAVRFLSDPIVYATELVWYLLSVSIYW